jgi:hypothetical protein
VHVSGSPEFSAIRAASVVAKLQHGAAEDGAELDDAR